MLKLIHLLTALQNINIKIRLKQQLASLLNAPVLSKLKQKFAKFRK